MWREIACNQWKSLHALKVPQIFSLLGWGGEGGFFPIFLIPKVFLSSSHWFPIMFSIWSSCSHCVPHYVPNSTPFFNPTCFGKCCPPLTYIDGPKGRNTTLILLWGLLQLNFISSISLPLRTGMEFSFHGLYRLLTLRKVFSLLGQSINLL
jgi:hypothetical protein